MMAYLHFVKNQGVDEGLAIGFDGESMRHTSPILQ
jgi:hypothetical protein